MQTIDETTRHMQTIDETTWHMQTIDTIVHHIQLCRRAHTCRDQDHLEYYLERRQYSTHTLYDILYAITQ